MSRKTHSARDLTSAAGIEKSESAQLPSNLHQMRSAVAGSEHEDAGLTGMTRSLDRRLLALNLQPMPPAGEIGYMKVA